MTPKTQRLPSYSNRPSPKDKKEMSGEKKQVELTIPCLVFVLVLVPLEKEMEKRKGKNPPLQSDWI